MPKFLTRIVTLILIPGLMVDPAMASSAHAARHSADMRATFAEAAFAPRLTTAKHLIGQTSVAVGALILASGCLRSQHDTGSGIGLWTSGGFILAGVTAWFLRSRRRTPQDTGRIFVTPEEAQKIFEWLRTDYPKTFQYLDKLGRLQQARIEIDGKLDSPLIVHIPGPRWQNYRVVLRFGNPGVNLQTRDLENRMKALTPDHVAGIMHRERTDNDGATLEAYVEGESLQDFIDHRLRRADGSTDPGRNRDLHRILAALGRTMAAWHAADLEHGNLHFGKIRIEVRQWLWWRRYELGKIFGFRRVSQPVNEMFGRADDIVLLDKLVDLKHQLFGNLDDNWHATFYDSYRQEMHRLKPSQSEKDRRILKPRWVIIVLSTLLIAVAGIGIAGWIFRLAQLVVETLYTPGIRNVLNHPHTLISFGVSAVSDVFLITISAILLAAGIAMWMDGFYRIQAARSEDPFAVEWYRLRDPLRSAIWKADPQMPIMIADEALQDLAIPLIQFSRTVAGRTPLSRDLQLQLLESVFGQFGDWKTSHPAYTAPPWTLIPWSERRIFLKDKVLLERFGARAAAFFSGFPVSRPPPGNAGRRRSLFMIGMALLCAGSLYSVMNPPGTDALQLASAFPLGAAMLYQGVLRAPNEEIPEGSGSASADTIRHETAEMLMKHYDLDPDDSKRGMLAMMLLHSTVERHGQFTQLRYDNRRLAEISPAGVTRFFEQNQRWIMTVDPSGFVTDQFQWASDGTYVTGWTWSPQIGKLSLKSELNPDIAERNEKTGETRNANLVQFIGRMPADSIWYVQFLPGIDFNNVSKIPFARVDVTAGGRPDISGIGASVMRVVSYLALDQGNSLRYRGNDTDPRDIKEGARLHLYNTLRETAMLGETPRIAGHAGPLAPQDLLTGILFTKIPTQFSWVPDPPELLMQGRDLAFYRRAGRTDRVFYRSYYFLRSEYFLHEKDGLLGIDKMPNMIADVPGGVGLFWAGEHIATIDAQDRIIWEKYPAGLPGETGYGFTLAPNQHLVNALASLLNGDYGLSRRGTHPSDLDDLLSETRAYSPETLGTGNAATQILMLSMGLINMIMTLPSLEEYPVLEAYYRLAIQRLHDNMEQLLPPESRVARAIVDFYGFSWVCRNTGLIKGATPGWMDDFMRLCTAPQTRLFAGQWERDYAEMLTGWSARELNHEWLRLAALRGKNVLPLPYESFDLFRQETGKLAHATGFNQYEGAARDERMHGFLQKELLLSLAMSAVYLEWAARHWTRRPLQSAVHGVPTIITPSMDYIRAAILDKTNPAFITPDQETLLELIAAIPWNLAADLLDLPHESPHAPGGQNPTHSSS